MNTQKKADLAATRPAKESEHLFESSRKVRHTQRLGASNFPQSVGVDSADVDTPRDDHHATLCRGYEIMEQYQLHLPRGGRQ